MTLLVLAGLICQQALAQSRDRLPTEKQPVLKTYPIVKAHAAEAERVLNEVFAQREIAIGHHSAHNTVLVWATDTEHSQIEYFLKQQQVLGNQLPRQEISAKLIALAHRGQQHPVMLRSTRFANTQAGDAGNSVPAIWQNQPAANTHGAVPVRQVAGYTQQDQAPASIGITPLSNNQTTRQIPLQKLAANQFEARILGALKDRSVQLTQSGTGNQVVYTIPLPGNQQMTMAIDRSSNIVSITGPGTQVDTFAQVISLLEAETPNSVTSIVPITPGNEQPVRDLARLINQPTNQFSTQGQATTENGIRFGNQTDNGQPAGPPLPPDVGGLVGPVEVTILDNGIVVINARTAKDLELARKIIEYIEATSREFDPIIVEVPMVHADCMRVAYVTQQLYTQWYDAQRGSVSITPLVRPNSILLIGYAGSIEAARELITKLDQPIDAEAQFQVFHLKYATAATLQTTLETFYSARTAQQTTGGAQNQNTYGSGLASEVNIVSDQRTNSLIVQAAPRDLLEIATMILKLDKSGNEVEMTVEIFPLRNTLAANLAELLNQALAGQTLTATGGGGMGMGTQQLTAPQSGISFTTIDAQQGKQVLSTGIFSGVAVVADSNGNNLIVKAPPECLPVIRAVIQNLDSPPLAVAQMKIFTIINSDAESLLTMLNQVFSTTQTGGGAAGSTFNNYQLGNSNENSALVPVRFAAETRTNSIVAVGSADMLAMVEAILLSLDEPEMHNRRLMVYRLINTPADTIASTLQTFLQNERQWRQQSDALVGEVDLFNTEVIITAETETNSLLVSTTLRNFEPLRRMIQVLDEQPAMVKIQVLIGEVDLSNTNELGFELGLQDSLLFDRSIAGKPGFDFNTGDPLGNDVTVSPKNVGTQGLSNFSLGRSNSELGYGGFVFAASSESVSVLVRALEERNKMTVLNRPMLNVLHNQTASLSVGQKVPTIVGSDTNQWGGQSNVMEEKEVGILLQVTPRIALNDSVAMQITATKSSMGAEAEGTPVFVQEGVTIRSPRTNESTIVTTIHAQSGQVAVLGGLINTEDKMVHRGVPVISNIPLLGQLFQYNYKYCSRKELIFIFTPQVSRSQEEADTLKQLELRRMHWCATHVSNLLDSGNAVKTRMDDFTSSDTIIEHGSMIRIDGNEAPSEERLLNQTPHQAPSFPTPGLL